LPGKSDTTNQTNNNSVTESGQELISGLTQLLILLILKKGPQHGYELASMFQVENVKPMWLLVLEELLWIMLKKA